MSDQFKAAVSVSKMAQMVGLGRARFYQLIGSAFPFPVYNVSNHRPIYVEELQKICLEIRRSGLGGSPRAAPECGPRFIPPLFRQSRRWSPAFLTPGAD